MFSLQNRYNKKSLPFENAQKLFYLQAVLFKKKGDTDRKLISLFKVPAKKLDEWKGIVNKSGLSLTSHLCSSHFEPRYFKIYIKSGQMCAD